MSLAVFCLSFLFIGLISHMSRFRQSGWRTLARAYRYAGKFSGEKWYFSNVEFHRKFCYWDGYGLTLIIGANSEGLYLGQMFPFQLAHPAILVPWSDVRAVNYKNPRISRTPVLILGRRPRVRIRVDRELRDKIGKYLQIN
jgi:hypothetical protein